MQQTTLSTSQTRGSKRLTFLSFLFLTLLFAGFTNNTNAQAGNTCGTAISISVNTTIADSLSPESVKWYSFVADTTYVKITENLFKWSVGHVHKMKLHKNCSGNVLASANITSTNDSTLTIIYNALVIGHTYYLKLSNKEPGCVRCAKGTATYSLFVNSHKLGPNLTPVISITDCGLNYAIGSVSLDGRGTPGTTQGQPQPATFTVPFIPLGSTVVAAYLYYSIIGLTQPIVSTTPQNTLITPLYTITLNQGSTNVLTTIPSTSTNAQYSCFLAGNDNNLNDATCWSSRMNINGHPSLFIGTTDNFRIQLNPADFAPLISTGLGGTYTIDGLPVFPTSTSVAFGNTYNQDVSGATLIIVYKQCGIATRGTFVLNDGIQTSGGAAVIETLGMPSIPLGGASPQNAFLITSDNENPAGIYSINSVSGTFSGPNAAHMWNCVSVNTSLPPSTITESYTVSTPGDCFNMVAWGAYYSVDDNSCLIPNLTVSPNTSICSGSSTVLTASSTSTGTGGVYSWSPTTGLSATTGSPVTASPTTTTTYTVTYTNSCGSNSATVNVQVSPLPNLTVGTNQSICLGQCVHIGTPASFSPFTSYSWSPATDLSCTNCVNPLACPTTTTTYTETVTNIITHCSSTGTVTVTVDPTCCHQPGYTVVPDNPDVLADFSPSYLITGNLSIAGTFTINQSATITAGSNLAMGPNAIIEVKPTFTLTIDNSRLFACGDMWNGIVVDPGGTLIVKNSSIIEDAKIGIEGQSTPFTSVAGSININSSKLNNNYQDIVIDPYDPYPSVFNTYPLTIEKSTLTCSADFGYSSNPYLKAPYAGQLTYKGVYLNTVEYPNITSPNVALPVITIGSTVAANTNYFSNMHFGVYALQSNFEVFNNNFTDIKGSGCGLCPTWGIAVFATTPITIGDYNTYNTAIVGNGPNTINTFSECYGAVSLQNYYYSRINNNTINNTSDLTPYIVGNFGIKVQQTTGYYGNIILRNTVKNTEIGINVLRNFTIYGPYPHIATFIDSNLIGATAGNLMLDGIYVQDVTPKVFDEFVKINYNTIKNTNNCINVLNLHSSFNLFVNENPILYVSPTTLPFISTPKAGIRLNGCAVVGYVQNNPDIRSPGTYIGTNPTTPSPADLAVKGIYLTLSPNVNVSCNVMHSLGQDMVFEGYCPSPGIFSNYMYGGAYDQFVLENNAIIFQQGDALDPIGDEWIGTPVRSQTYTYNTTDPASNSALYVAAGSTTTPIHNKTNGAPSTDSYNESGALNSALGTSLNCTFIDAINPKLLNKIAQDSVQYAIMVPQTKYINKHLLYRHLAQNDSLMLGDTVLQHFYTNTQSSNIGTLYAVDTLLSTGNLATASTLNNGIAPTNAIEQNQQDVNNVYMSTLGIGHDTLSPTQYNTLNAVAVQCPIVGGMAVYRARVMLNWMLDTVIEYTDSCGSSSMEELKPIKATSSSNLNANVYPNPASTLLNVALNITQLKAASICLYNTTGEKVRCETLSGNLTSISITDLPSGMYYYRITDTNGNLVKADKVTIIK